MKTEHNSRTEIPPTPSVKAPTAEDERIWAPIVGLPLPGGIPGGLPVQLPPVAALFDYEEDPPGDPQESSTAAPSFNGGATRRNNEIDSELDSELETKTDPEAEQEETSDEVDCHGRKCGVWECRSCGELGDRLHDEWKDRER